MDANNYEIYSSGMPVQTTASISKAILSVAVTAHDKVYDGTTTALTNLSDNRIAGDYLIIESDGSSFADKNVGTGKVVSVSGINVAGADAGNYEWNVVASTAAEITKAVLNVTASAQSKTYDGSDKTKVFFGDDRISGDDIKISSTSAKFSDKNAGSHKDVTATGLSVSGLDASNYFFDLTSITTQADINKATLLVTASGLDKAYNGSADAGVTFTDNRIAGDILSVTGNAAFTDKNAGSTKQILVGGISVTGTDARNYNWNSAAATTADISKANLVVQSINGSKTEGEQDGLLDWSLKSGNLYGDDAILGSLNRAPGEVAGEYDIEQGTLSAGSNYRLSVVPGRFTIVAAAKPPVVVTPPVPPIKEPSKPTVNAELESAKEIISTVSVAAQASQPKTEKVFSEGSNTLEAMGDYRLLNLGMKLPDDIQSEEMTGL